MTEQETVSRFPAPLLLYSMFYSNQLLSGMLCVSSSANFRSISRNTSSGTICSILQATAQALSCGTPSRSSISVKTAYRLFTFSVRSLPSSVRRISPSAVTVTRPFARRDFIAYETVERAYPRSAATSAERTLPFLRLNLYMTFRYISCVSFVVFIFPLPCLCFR